MRIKGLQVQKNLNGLCGSIVDWDTNEERWKAGWGLYSVTFQRVDGLCSFRVVVAHRFLFKCLKRGVSRTLCSVSFQGCPKIRPWQL